MLENSPQKMLPVSDPIPQHQRLKTEIEQAVLEVMRSGHYILGRQVAAFEAEAAHFLKARHAVACASGTDALLLSLVALGIKRGDEVITSTFSFISAAEVACYLGATPVLVDISPYSFNLDPDCVAEQISEKTRAIIAVHLFGQSADMDALSQIAEQYQLHLIEDCAQAFGAKYRENYVGALSAAGCHSFYPTKNLAAYGDGGLISTNDINLVAHLHALRNHGSYTRYQHDEIGYNSRLDEIQAAILRVKLKYIESFNNERAAIAAQYDALLKDHVKIPARDAYSSHIFHQYTILSPHRDAIKQALSDNAIAANVYYPHLLGEQLALHKRCRLPPCPNAEAVAKQCLSLPIYPGLSSATIEHIAEIIIATLKQTNA